MAGRNVLRRLTSPRHIQTYLTRVLLQLILSDMTTLTPQQFVANWSSTQLKFNLNPYQDQPAAMGVTLKKRTLTNLYNENPTGLQNWRIANWMTPCCMPTTGHATYRTTTSSRGCWR